MTEFEPKQRIKMLKEIIRDVRMMRQGASPTTPWVALGLIGGGVIGFLFNTYVLQFSDLDIALLGGLVGSFAGYCYAKNKTWDERIYARLTEYQPLNKEAYRDIQTSAAGDKLTSDKLLEWAALEMDMVSPRNDTAADLARQRFASK